MTSLHPKKSDHIPSNGSDEEDIIMLGTLRPHILPPSPRTIPKSNDSNFPSLFEALSLKEAAHLNSKSLTTWNESTDDETALETFPETPKKNCKEHACGYCGVEDDASAVQCQTCKQWFCNSRGRTSDAASSGTHIVQHLVRAKHREICLHVDSALGDTCIECYHCGSKNIFLLGFIPSKSDDVVIILCRQPCGGTAGAAKDETWDLNAWNPLINERALLPWIAASPSPALVSKSTPISPAQIAHVEEMRRIRPEYSTRQLVELVLSNKTLGFEDQALSANVEPVRMRYSNSQEFRTIMENLVELEAVQSRESRAAQRQNDTPISWSIGLSGRALATFPLPSAYLLDADFRIVVGDEVLITHIGSKWEVMGAVARITADSIVADIAQIPKASKTSLDPRSCPSSLYTIEFVWKSTAYDRMVSALNKFTDENDCMSPLIREAILGRLEDGVEFSECNLPEIISAPNLPELNYSQAETVRSVLQRPLALVQGPPGTGKTVTCATIVWNLVQMQTGPVLVVASSNVAVDHLTDKIGRTGLRVTRLLAKWREAVDSSIINLSLTAQALEKAPSELRKLDRLKQDVGELNSADSNRYYRLLHKAELDVLNNAQVICTTAIGAGSSKLDHLNFACVLFDEATQATEPEALIPIVRGSRHVVMVGDHRQLGPVILNRRAAKAGFGQSLFERLIALGTHPLRLQVQYRMHPSLSAFPSAVFYEGALQDGITSANRSRPGLDFPWPCGPERPHFFLAVMGSEELSPSGTSFLNRAEAISVERIVSRLLRAGVLPAQIGIVTPYTGQRSLIYNQLQTSGSLGNPALYAEVEVASVDAFQGREKDYIVLSCVRSNDTQSIGFLSDARRLNVALTRAKYGLVIVGNPRALSRNPLWHHLLMHYRERGLLVEGPLTGLRPCIVQLSRPKIVIPSRSRPLHHLLPISTAPNNSSTISRNHPDFDLDETESVNLSQSAVSLTGFSQASFNY